MFSKTKQQQKELRFEKNLVDRAVEMYKEEQELAVAQTIDRKEKEIKELDKRIASKENELDSRVLEIREGVADEKIKVVEQRAEYEHEFHSDREERGIVLARLDAQINERKTLLAELGKEMNARLDAKDQVIEAKDTEIKFLRDLIQKNFPTLLEKSQVVINNEGDTCDCDEESSK